MWPFTSPPHLIAIKEHVAQRDRLLTKNALSSSGDKDASILAADIAGMVSGVQEGKWTATELLEAFIRSTRRAQARTNCVAEVAFDSALKRAAELDAEFAETGKLRGPLHGVPFSLKDCYHLEGTHLTIGFSSWLKNGRSTESAAIVRLAEAHGAVCFVQTNVPQTMIAIDSRNPVFGQTGNPWAPAHVAGGSSGGEAALLAADGAAFGIGSDIGGSLRIPAHFCGIYSLKPSSGRYPNAGTCRYNEGFHSIHVVTGPMTRSLADLELLHRLNMETLHPSEESEALTLRDTQLKYGAENLVPAPLRPLWLDALGAVEKRGRPLRLGYFLTDGFSRTSPACIRAVLACKKAMESKHGSQVEFVELAASEVRGAHAMRTFLAIMSADRFNSARKHIHPDPVDPAMKLAFLLPSLPAFVRKLFVFIVRYILRDRAFAYVVERAGAKTAGGLIAAQADADDFVTHWNERIWQRHRLDGIVCPVFALPAPKHHGTDEISGAVAPTVLFNVLDNPAVTLPVLRVDAKLDAASNKNPSSYWKQANFKDCSKLLAYRMYGGGSSAAYDAARMAGLPVGVQVVTQRYEDEKAIGLARLLDEALGERGFGPGAFSRTQKA